jgi:ABC-type glycerol-3-phosphate transport system substrate-binding protein
MRARLGAVAAIALSGLFLGGCSSPQLSNESVETESSESSKPSVVTATTLSILSNVQAGTPAGDVLDAVIATFEVNTGAKVELVQVGEDIPIIYETSVAGGKEADIVMVNLTSNTKPWLGQGISVPVTDFIKDWNLTDSILPAAVEIWTDSEGRVQGFPYSGFVWPVWYNMELLNSVGVDAPPSTMLELLYVARELREKGIAPFVIGGNDWSGQKLFLQIIQSYMPTEEAVDVFSTGGYCASANAMKGINLFVQLRDEGVFIDDAEGYTAAQMNASFFEGRAAMMSAGSWAMGASPEDLRENVVLGGLPLPSAGSAFSKPTAYQGYTGGGFFVSNNGAAEEKMPLVKEFVSLWYSPEVASSWAAATNAPNAFLGASSLDGGITNTLTKQVVENFYDRVEFAVMPDPLLPGGMAPEMIRQTSLAYAPGSSSTAICEAIDGLY